MELSLDELAAEAIRLGRELERAAHAASLGRSSREVGYASRTLRRLAERDPFDPHDDVSLTSLEAIMQADLKSEVRGCERRFVETRYDNLGQYGEVRDCPIYSASRHPEDFCPLHGCAGRNARPDCCRARGDPAACEVAVRAPRRTNRCRAFAR